MISCSACPSSTRYGPSGGGVIRRGTHIAAGQHCSAKLHGRPQGRPDLPEGARHRLLGYCDDREARARHLLPGAARLYRWVRRFPARGPDFYADAPKGPRNQGNSPTASTTPPRSPPAPGSSRTSSRSSSSTRRRAGRISGRSQTSRQLGRAAQPPRQKHQPFTSWEVPPSTILGSI